MSSDGLTVDIKPLEWEDADEGMCTKWRAAALGGHYDLVNFGKDDPGFAVNFSWGRPLSYWFIQGEPNEWGPTGPKIFPTLDEAKAAAQADYARRILSALSKPAPVARYSIEFDGFTGTVIGSYTTLEGKEGVVLQQDGTRVVHVYGRKHLKPAPVAANASAEARLREALEPFAAVAEKDIGESETDDDYFRPMTTNNHAPRLKVGHLRAALNALSPDPHASDCEKQVVPSGYSEYTPIKVVGSNSEPRGCPVPGACKPSDRTADVTVDELADFIYDKGYLVSGGNEEEGLSRALLDAFTVGRR